MCRSPLSAIACITALVTLAVPALGQTPAPASPLANWTGAIRCDIESQADGYAHQESQTWTLTGAPTVQGSVIVYPATWTVTGQGRHDRTRSTTRRMAQWTVNVPGPNSPARALIGFTLHPGGQEFDVAKRHAQLTVSGGYTGPEQYINDGVAQAPGRLAGTVYEWQFPKIEAGTSETQLIGSNTSEIKAFVGPLQPFDAQVRVTCTWALARRAAPPLAPSAISTVSPPADLPRGATSPSAGQAGTRSAPVAPLGSTTAPPETTPTPTATTPSTPSMITTGSQPNGVAVVPSTGTSAPPPPQTMIAGTPAPSGTRPSGATRTSATSTGTTLSEIVTPAPPPAAPSNRLVITAAPPARVSAGNVFNVQVQAMRPDNGGEFLDTTFGQSVTIVAAAPGGSGFPSPVSTNATFGTANFSVFLNDAANGYTITASAAGFANGISPSFDITARRLALSPIGNVASGVPFTVTATAVDANNDVAENFTGIVTLTTTLAGASIGSNGTVTATAVGGRAAFTIVLNAAAAGYQTTATAAGLTGVVSNMFDVTTSTTTAAPTGSGAPTRPLASGRPVPATVPPPTSTATSPGTSTTPTATSAGGASMIASGSEPTGGGLTVDRLITACAVAPAPPYSATPGGVTFTLNRPTGTTSYHIWRRDLGELTASPITAVSFTHAAPLEYQLTYEYGVSGVQSDGGCTTSTVTVTPPKPLTPQVSARATVSGSTGRVTLSWGMQADRPTGYLVLGPGLPQEGIEVAASTDGTGHSVDTASLPLGAYGWLVTPLWKTPVGTMIDVSTGARVTATVGGSAGAVVPDSIWDTLTKIANTYADTLKATIAIAK